MGQSNVLSIPDQTLAGGDTAWVEINVTNTDDIAGFQFDLSYPSEFTYIDSIQLGDRFVDHELEVEFLDPFLRVMAYSASLTPITGNSGTVLTVGLVTEPVLGEFEIEFLNPVLANTDYENVLTGSVNGTINLDTPAPQLAPFVLTEIMEDGRFVIHEDTLLAHVSDVDTPLEDIIFTLEADFLTITPDGDDHLVNSPSDWDGMDTVWVTASDGYYYDQEPWPVYVVNVNDPPVLADISEIQFNEDTDYTLDLDSLVTDVDDDQSDLVWDIEANSEDIQIELDIEANVLIITSDQDFFGSGMEISFMVQDTSLAADSMTTAVTVLPVNDPPVFLSALPDISFDEDSVFSQSLSDWYELVDDVDDLDSELQWNFNDNPYLTIIEQDTEIIITPEQDWNGEEVITVIVTDGFLSDTTDLLVSVESVNDAPEDFDLLAPDDQFLVSVSDVTFQWNGTTDVDDTELDTYFHLMTDDRDIIEFVEGDSYALNVYAQGLPYGQPVQWWVEVSDGDTSTLSETRTFTVSTDLYHNGPSWFVDTEGSDTNGNGSAIYPFGTIQHAHDVSAESDTVVVQVGTYYENITIDHSVNIVGSVVFGDRPSLDGGSSGRIMTVGDNAALSVRDLTFSNGYLSAQGGGAILSSDGPLQVIDCSFIGNNSYGGGAAIKSYSDDLLIKNCYFEDNHSLSSNGGALEIQTGQVDSCTFVANTADASGGAINIEGNATISRSLFIDNSSGSKGGAIYIALAAANIINNTIYNNQSNYGGGISTYNSSSSIVNTILWQNLAYSSGGQVYHSGSPNPVYEYCDIQGGASGTGNINEDPVFLDPNLMLFDLIEGSPCIDAGDPDLDGDGIAWTDDTDDQDLDGTRMDIGAFTYLGPDTIPPTVGIVTPNGGESFGTGETVTFEWQADDDRVINWTQAFISFNGGSDYVQIDSSSGNPGGIYWNVPEDVVTSQGMLRILVSDWGDNVSLDESDGFFSIVDVIDPAITLDSPGNDFSIPEHEMVTVSWTSSDNIGVDSVHMYFDGGTGEFLLVGSVAGSVDEASFEIPVGVTDQARIRLIATDLEGNTAESMSTLFSITDNTPPYVDITTPEGASISQTIDLEWSASDNTTLRSHHLYYSQEPGYEYVFIDSVDGAVSTLSWVAPNFVSDQVQIRVETFDVVNLSTSDTTSYFSISDGTPPTISISAPTAGSSVAEHEDLTVTWSASDNIEMDSVRVHYSNDGGNEFTLMGQVPHPNTDLTFSVPSGVTDIAQVRLVAIDIHGNEGEDTSDDFSVTDNTPPVVDMNNTGNVHIGDEITLSWSASDNTGIEYHRIYLSSGLSLVFSQIDSVAGSESSVQWTVPNIDTEEARLAIVSTDLVGLVDSDTTEIFSILDGIAPQVTVTGPGDGHTVPEFHPVTVTWDASDNIGLDSAWVWYSVSGDEYISAGNTLASNSEYSFMVPQGMTDQARIMVQVSDLAENTSEDTTAAFTVTDYTPPTVSVTTPITGDRFDIDGTMDIAWLASDNVSVTGVDISYSTDQGESWYDIASNISNTGSYQWTVVNDPSDNVLLRSIAFDEVGLSDTSIVSGLAIDIVYPKVNDITPAPGNISWLDQELSISFDQKMMPEGFDEQFVQFISEHSDSVSASFNYVDSTQTVHVDLSNGFAGLDTITIILDAGGVSNYYGYPLDGDGDGTGGDNYTYEYNVGMVADYNSDDVINGSDLTTFLSSWDNDNFVNELGPYSGTVPNVVVHPDQDFNIEDVMSFVVIGNWYLSNYGMVASTMPVSGPEISVEIDKDSIFVGLPDGAIAFDMQLDHEPDVFSSELITIDEDITLIHKNPGAGLINIISKTTEARDIVLSYDLIDKQTHVNLYVQAYGSEGSVISNMLETIEINAIPEEFSLSQNYPNPFNPVTHIDYGLPFNGKVKLSVYDLLGRRVITLVDGEQEAGYRTVTWNGSDQRGETVGTGMYFYVIQAGDLRKVRKMLLLK